MRFLVLLSALLLSGCWAGDGLYSKSDARQPIPAGTYRATDPDGKTRLENIALLPDGMTRIGDTDGKGLYGFAPLDEQNRRFVAWYHEDSADPDDRTQVYMLLERRSDDEFVLYAPQCDGDGAEIATRAGARVEKGSVDTCVFATRASVETALRQIRNSEDAIRIVRFRGK